jgi:hypothetical protein
MHGDQTAELIMQPKQIRIESSTGAHDELAAGRLALLEAIVRACENSSGATNRISVHRNGRALCEVAVN